MPNLSDYVSQFVKFLNDLGWLANLLAVAPIVLGIIVIARKRIRKLLNARNQTIRYETNRKMNSTSYLEWVQCVVSKIYGDLEFVSIYGRKHPAVILRPGKRFDYPFTDLCHLTSTDIRDIRLNRLQKRYLRFLGDSVKRPKMKGFAVKEILLDELGRVAAVNAQATNYQQNLVTAHILEWELFKRYDKNKEITDDILLDLKFRSTYHGGQTPLEAVLKPSGAYPLISVQALVIYKDYKDPNNVMWKAIVAQRQKNVAIKPELWQIQPAGGFEVYGHEDDDLDIQLRQGFDVRAALFREYAEEIYDIEELSFRSDGRDSGSILSEPHISHLIELIHANKASMDFLGIITDLTILRQELSFLIVIDDPEYSRHPILGSSEAKNIFSLSMAELKTTFSTQNVHSSSAGLLQLAIESDRLRTLGISSSLADRDLSMPA
jgi:hypothetical protein